ATMTYAASEGVITKLSRDKVRTLWRFVSGYQFFAWHDNLTNDHPGMTDHFPMGLAATANGRRNTIRCLDRCPTGTGEIVKIVRDETHALEWTAAGKKKLPRKR